MTDRVLEAGLKPLFLDMRGADWISADDYVLRTDARRFENWEFAYALLLGLGDAAWYARGVGEDVAWQRARGLAAEWLGPAEARDRVAIAAEWIDVVKLGWAIIVRVASNFIECGIEHAGWV